MKVTNSLKLNIYIHQSCEKIWDVLTKEELFCDCFKFLKIKCNNWQIGGKITFKSQNSNIIDFAIITELQTFKKLAYKYHKMNSNDFQLIVFDIYSIENNYSKICITGKNFRDKDEYNHSKTAWNLMLETLKIYLETDKKL
ncbi:hypothetical protein ETU08_01450 [Apibacter muscae]|uniref:SRPBCC domain-containing protein n=1 Tax=Apibacter muscae TaxID=2509004 RepID=UPI0011ABF028|nr:SRPBCC domain-containing protein [Apibacter muscae]TWP31341.1 hypothetical protein ETU08_01450 [Apibacter muscae]